MLYFDREFVDKAVPFCFDILQSFCQLVVLKLQLSVLFTQVHNNFLKRFVFLLERLLLEILKTMVVVGSRLV